MQSETDLQCFIHLMHGWAVERAHPVFQAAFVNGTDLFQQDNAVPCQSTAIRLHGDVGWYTNVS